MGNKLFYGLFISALSFRNHLCWSLFLNKSWRSTKSKFWYYIIIVSLLLYYFSLFVTNSQIKKIQTKHDGRNIRISFWNLHLKLEEGERKNDDHQIFCITKHKKKRVQENRNLKKKIKTESRVRIIIRSIKETKKYNIKKRNTLWCLK